MRASIGQSGAKYLIAKVSLGVFGVFGFSFTIFLPQSFGHSPSRSVQRTYLFDTIALLHTLMSPEYSLC